MRGFAFRLQAMRKVCAPLYKYLWAKFRNANIRKATECNSFLHHNRESRQCRVITNEPLTPVSHLLSAICKKINKRLEWTSVKISNNFSLLGLHLLLVTDEKTTRFIEPCRSACSNMYRIIFSFWKIAQFIKPGCNGKHLLKFYWNVCVPNSFESEPKLLSSSAWLLLITWKQTSIRGSSDLSSGM